MVLRGLMMLLLTSVMLMMKLLLVKSVDDGVEMGKKVEGVKKKVIYR
jgi:hypothetical protein